MKKILYILIISLSGCASLPTVQSLAPSEVEPGSYRTYDADSGIRYQVSNDSTNLYLKMNTNNFITIRSILAGGLKVYIDSEGKKNRSTFIQYPMPQLAMGNEVDQREENHLFQKTDRLLTKDLLFVKGEIRMLIRPEEVSGIKAVAEQIGEEFTYQLTVPLTEVGLAADHAKEINPSIGIETGEVMKRQGQGQKGSRQGTGMGQGGGGRGGMGGGGGGQGRGGMASGGMPGTGPQGTRSPVSPVSFWFGVQLDGAPTTGVQ